MARAEIVNMQAYRSARSEVKNGKIWLDANENPWQQALLYNRYPEPQPSALVAVLSALYAVEENQVLVTRGSDEGIDLLVRLFCAAGKDKILICPPTYGMYQVAASIQGAAVMTVPLIREDNFKLNTKKILEVWQPSIKIIFLCSPNNPSGNLLASSDILALCEKLKNQAIIVVDEAYIEFAAEASLVKNLNDYANLIILRTLSKAYGLAGLRCGVTIANSEIIQLLKKIIAPYPISRPVTELVIQQLKYNLQNTQQQISQVILERDKLYQLMSQLPWIKNIWKSQANFILFEAENAQLILKMCAKLGLILRDRSQEYGLSNCIRISIGLPQENQLLMEVLQNV